MNKLQLIDADTLYYKPLAHPKMLIDGVLSDGLAILAGDSKIGKSWMVLWLCLQISRGEAVWGLPTRKTDVVYLALEDREWRVQQRMQELTDSPPENLRFGFSCGQLGAELEGQIEDAVRFKARMDTEPGFLSELSGMFSNRTEWHPLPMFEATPENCEAFRRWLNSQWAELPEALPTQTARNLSATARSAFTNGYAKKCWSASSSALYSTAPKRNLSALWHHRKGWRTRARKNTKN